MKANLEIQDTDGDTALHYSCFGNQPEIAELLIQNNANINSVNNNGCSALHVAVNKLHITCVKVLLKYKCDCNIQVSNSLIFKFDSTNSRSLINNGH